MSKIEVKESDRSLVEQRDEKLIGRLAADQQNAMELLVMGKTIAETARSAGVSRTTIYHWLRHDPVFQAAYNQWHDQLEEGCRSRLLTLTDKATDAIEKALENGDARAALQLLKGMGMIRHKIVGPTDAEEIRARDEIRKEKKRIALKRDKGGRIMEDLLAEGGM
jgi:AcrR family transcriptional regulator